MSLLAELGVNPAEVNLDEVEKKMAAGDLMPEGIHHVVLTAVGGIPNAEARGWKLTFQGLAGAGKGAVVEETLWKPKGESEKKDATTRNRILLFAHRLGLLKKVPAADGKSEKTVEIEGKHDFCDCLGATCFIEVQHEEREYTKEGKTRKITEARMTFGGVLGPEDKKVKDGIAAGKIAVAGAGAAAAAVGAAGKAGATGSKPKDDFGDL